jgi:exodeoxyribonuclease V alpha subunit
MLDINLTASLLKALAPNCQLLLIGDPDQLPSVGAGSVLNDLLKSSKVPTFNLTKIFRQAAKSNIIKYAHEINRGSTPKIPSPIKDSSIWNDGTDCFFIDSEEATKEQIRFISKVKKAIGTIEKEIEDPNIEYCLNIPNKFRHVNIEKVAQASNQMEELKAVLKSVHPHSTLHFGHSALETIVRLYSKTIKEKFGTNTEVQILSPQIRGSLGTANLNRTIQQAVNPPAAHKAQIAFGDKLFRINVRVIQTRNNYDLLTFNGDIGVITNINSEDQACTLYFKEDDRYVEYKRENIGELMLAYAITIHKSQGSEFGAVIIPVTTQHFKMLFRNLIYTGLTRAKKAMIFVGNRKALAMAINTIDNRERQTFLKELLDNSNL